MLDLSVIPPTTSIDLYSNDISDYSMVAYLIAPIDFTLSEIFNHSLQGYSCFFYDFLLTGHKYLIKSTNVCSQFKKDFGIKLIHRPTSYLCLQLSRSLLRQECTCWDFFVFVTVSRQPHSLCGNPTAQLWPPSIQILVAVVCVPVDV